jgi:hypothetical protein
MSNPIDIPAIPKPNRIRALSRQIQNNRNRNGSPPLNADVSK